MIKSQKQKKSTQKFLMGALMLLFGCYVYYALGHLEQNGSKTLIYRKIKFLYDLLGREGLLVLSSIVGLAYIIWGVHDLLKQRK